MESSIAVFLMRWSACELLPTIVRECDRDIRHDDHDRSCVQAMKCENNVYTEGLRSAWPLDYPTSYLLGLLAMIKCSICSYQCDN